MSTVLSQEDLGAFSQWPGPRPVVPPSAKVKKLNKQYYADVERVMEGRDAWRQYLPPSAQPPGLPGVAGIARAGGARAGGAHAVGAHAGLQQYHESHLDPYRGQVFLGAALGEQQRYREGYGSQVRKLVEERDAKIDLLMTEFERDLRKIHALIELWKTWGSQEWGRAGFAKVPTPDQLKRVVADREKKLRQAYEKLRLKIVAEFNKDLAVIRGAYAIR